MAKTIKQLQPHKFSAGDTVKVVSAGRTEWCKIGDTHTIRICKHDQKGEPVYVVDFDKDDSWIRECNLELVERDRQKGGEWKRHRGGAKPKSVSDSDMVEVRLRCGDTQTAYAGNFLWNYADCDHSVNITKYRVISQPQAEEVELNVRVDSAVNVEYAFGSPDADMSKLDWRALGTCNLGDIDFSGKGEIIHGPISMDDEVIAPAHPEYKGTDTNMGTLSYMVDTDTSPAIKALNELSAKWDQIETPFKWRDEVTELNAYIEKYTRERDALIELLASEGFALIPAMTPVMGFAPISLPFGEWEPGDFVTSKVDYNHQFTKGKKYKVTGTNMSLGKKRVSVESDDKGKANGWLANHFEFHSRP